jgi:hypothetical protein
MLRVFNISASMVLPCATAASLQATMPRRYGIHGQGTLPCRCKRIATHKKLLIQGKGSVFLLPENGSLPRLSATWQTGNTLWAAALAISIKCYWHLSFLVKIKA